MDTDYIKALFHRQLTDVEVTYADPESVYLTALMGSLRVSNRPVMLEIMGNRYLLSDDGSLARDYGRQKIETLYQRLDMDDETLAATGLMQGRLAVECAPENCATALWYILGLMEKLENLALGNLQNGDMAV